MNKTADLKKIRKLARDEAHQNYRNMLSDEDQAKLKGDEIIFAMYINSRGGYQELSPLCYKGIYKKMKKQYMSEGHHGY